MFSTWVSNNKQNKKVSCWLHSSCCATYYCKKQSSFVKIRWHFGRVKSRILFLKVSKCTSALIIALHWKKSIRPHLGSKNDGYVFSDRIIFRYTSLLIVTNERHWRKLMSKIFFYLENNAYFFWQKMLAQSLCSWGWWTALTTDSTFVYEIQALSSATMWWKIQRFYIDGIAKIVELKLYISAYVHLLILLDSIW